MKRDVLGDLAIAFGLGVLVGVAFKGAREALKENTPRLPLSIGDLLVPVTSFTPISTPAPSPPKPPAAPQRAQASAALPFDWITDNSPLDLWSPPS